MCRIRRTTRSLKISTSLFLMRSPTKDRASSSKMKDQVILINWISIKWISNLQSRAIITQITPTWTREESVPCKISSPSQPTKKSILLMRNICLSAASTTSSKTGSSKWKWSESIQWNSGTTIRAKEICSQWISWIERTLKSKPRCSKSQPPNGLTS
jgi:hypothetical protein